MKQKIVVITTVVMIGTVFAVFLLGLLSRSPSTPIPELTDTTLPRDTPETSSNGHITANDAPSNGQPKHITRPIESNNAIAASRKNRANSASEGRYITINDKSYPLRKYQALAMPNDPMADQWWVHNTALPAMWDQSPGSRQVTMAVIDTGFALNHEEFGERWHKNISETGSTTQQASSLLNCTDRSLPLNQNCNLVDDNTDGVTDNESGTTTYENPSKLNCTDQGVTLDKRCNRIDDDSNNLIDDVTGWDFVDQHSSIQAGKLNPSGEGTTHGTKVAGVAAASGNNNKGIAGVDWNTKILPIQAIDDDGYGDTRTVGKAIFYAVEQGVDVINLSLGTSAPDSYVREAVEAATAAGVVVIAASGNDGCECILYPANDPEVVAVGALAADGSRASFSSWGKELDIVAPGASMTLPSWSASNSTNRYTSNEAGTSFAAPLVSGTVSKMLSHSADAQPLHIIAALTEQSTRVNANDFDIYYGFGKINANASVTRMKTPSEPRQNYAFGPIHAGTYYTPANPLEAPGKYVPQVCVSGTASTRIYELKNASDHFFSISKVEVRNAVSFGLGASLFAYTCQQLPHDNPTNVRTINMFSEFRNIYHRP